MKRSVKSRAASIIPTVARESSASETAAGFLKCWLQRLGYYSIFAALPVILSEPAEAASDDTPSATPPAGLPLERRFDRRRMSARTDRVLSARPTGVDIVSAFTGGGD